MLNFSVSTLANAPGTGGTTFTVASGEGARFPDPAESGVYAVTVFPVDAPPDPTNAEIVWATAKSGDSLTVTRAQEGTTARNAVSGDRVHAGISAAMWANVSKGGGTPMDAFWTYRTDTGAADPGPGRFRLNNAAKASATAMYLDDLTQAGTDISNIAALVATGDVVFIQDQDDASKWLRATVSSTPTDNTGWWTVPITVDETGGGEFTNNDRILFLWSIAAITGSGGGGSVALDDAGTEVTPAMARLDIHGSKEIDEPTADEPRLFIPGPYPDFDYTQYDGGRGLAGGGIGAVATGIQNRMYLMPVIGGAQWRDPPIYHNHLSLQKGNYKFKWYRPAGYTLDELYAGETSNASQYWNAGAGAAHLISTAMQTYGTIYLGIVWQNAGSLPQVGYMQYFDQSAPSTSLYFPVPYCFYQDGVSGAMPASSGAPISGWVSDRGPAWFMRTRHTA